MKPAVVAWQQEKYVGCLVLDEGGQSHVGKAGGMVIIRRYIGMVMVVGWDIYSAENWRGCHIDHFSRWPGQESGKGKLPEPTETTSGSHIEGSSWGKPHCEHYSCTSLLLFLFPRNHLWEKVGQRGLWLLFWTELHVSPTLSKTVHVVHCFLLYQCFHIANHSFGLDFLVGVAQT